MKSVTRLWVAAVLLAVIPSIGRAQATRRVTGQVTVQGSTNPVPGASVQVVGTTLGTTADENGNFSVSVPAGNQTLRIRRIGYTARLIPVAASQSTVAASLVLDALQLETQVITGQATTVSSRNAANAVTVVTTEQLNRVPQQNIEDAMKGKVPGAVITQNGGAPGGGVQVQIRGSNTVNGSYQPLYVIDGVIANNDAYSIGLNSITGAGGGISGVQDQQVNRIADINPSDIESIEVLKGASAGAIYGSRGANGVIIITTKRGQAGKPSLNIVQRLGTQALSNKYNMRCFTLAQAQAESKADYGITLDPANYGGCVDAQDVIYGNRFLSYETGASIRGGAQNTTYFASADVKHDGGLALNTGYSKQSLRLNLNQAMGGKLTLQGSSEILHTLTQRGISGNDNNNIAPYTIIGATPTYFDPRKKDPLTGQFVSDPYIGGGANVLQDQASIQTPENVYRLIGNVQGNWSIFSSDKQTLNLTGLGGVDAYTDHGRVYSPPFTYIETSGNISPYPGSVVDANTNVANANLNASLVHKLIMGFGTATTSGGLRQERSESNNVYDRGQGLFPGITNFATGVQTAVAQGQVLTKTFSYYGQEEFLTMADRLLLTAALNAERSSTNGDTAKFYAFPKFSASYNVPWLFRGLDNFKVRLAYGKAGNRVPSDFKYTFLTQLAEAGIIGIRPSTIIGLANIQPEVTAETEGGFDAQMFGGRASFEFTAYHKSTTGLVLQASLPGSSGFTTANINGGSIANNGTELGLTLLPIQTANFSWQSRTTYARNRGLVTSLPVPAFYTGNGFGERTARTKVEKGYAPDEVVAYEGFDTTFVNGAYSSRARHEAHIGSASPDFTMGFSNDFTAGSFHLSTLIDWRKGGYIADLSQTYLENGVNGQSGITGGSFADTAMNNKDQTAYANGYAAFLEHGSFAKLREVTLSYSLSPRLASTLFRGTTQDVRFEVSGHNLKTWTNYRGLDPEVSNFGNAPLSRLWDLAPYPPSRQFFFSVDANF